MITLVPDRIDAFFEGQNHQADVLIGLYKFVFPDWDNIVSLDGYPTVNEHTWKYICEKFIAFDKIYHPDVFAGGLFMNKGFSVDYKLTQDWKVYIDDCKAEYKND